MHENPFDKTKPPERELMSRLADGDLVSADDACVAWRDDPGAREAWATYHLIGDALRSEELAAGLSRSEIFLTGFRRRLADEPVLLVPSAPSLPAAAAQRRRMHWAGPVAAAAGFAVVAVTMVVLRTADPVAPDAHPVARGPGSSPAVVPVAGTPVADEPQWQTAHRKLIRDQQLDAYLRAHRGAPEATPGAAAGRFENAVLDR